MLSKMMMTTRADGNDRSGFQSRSFDGCSIREMEGSERQFNLSFSSEEPYERWYGTEILSHKDDAVDLTRLNSIGCVLYNHNRDRVIGKIIRAWVENGRGEAQIRFDDDEDSETIYQKVKNKTLRGVSVGYRVLDFEEVKPGKRSADGRFEGPCYIASRWVPMEVSIVSIPADGTVGVGRSDSGPQIKKGPSGLYYTERQLQINKNLFNRR